MILISEKSFVCFICTLVVSEGTRSCSSHCLNDQCDDITGTRQCSSHCLNDKCDNITGVCDECPDDRYGNYCGQNCTLCKDEQCDKLHCIDGCKNGYYQTIQGEFSDCFKCSRSCLSCQNSAICTKCDDGYFVQVSGDVHSCQKCSWNCATCSTINDCFSCEPGYYGEYCEYSCSEAIHNCSLCNGSIPNNVICNQCANGMLMKNNTCEAGVSHVCPSNCMSCLAENACELCKNGWYGARCDKACSDNIDHCLVCQETNDVVICTTCSDEYKLSNGTCVSKTANQVTSTPIKTDSTLSQTSSVLLTSTTESASVPDYVESFQTSTFLVGFVSGLGTCLCSVLLVGLIFFMKRRKRQKQDDQATKLHDLGQPFYENSITADALRLTSASSEGQRQENIEQVNVTDDNNTYEYTRQTRTGSESSAQIEILSSPNGDQHNYTRLTIGQAEHVYKDLTPM